MANIIITTIMCIKSLCFYGYVFLQCMYCKYARYLTIYPTICLGMSCTLYACMFDYVCMFVRLFECMYKIPSHEDWAMCWVLRVDFSPCCLIAAQVRHFLGGQVRGSLWLPMFTHGKLSEDLTSFTYVTLSVLSVGEYWLWLIDLLLELAKINKLGCVNVGLAPAASSRSCCRVMLFWRIPAVDYHPYTTTSVTNIGSVYQSNHIQPLTAN